MEIIGKGFLKRDKKGNIIKADIKLNHKGTEILFGKKDKSKLIQYKIIRSVFDNETQKTIKFLDNKSWKKPSK